MHIGAASQQQAGNGIVVAMVPSMHDRVQGVLPAASVALLERPRRDNCSTISGLLRWAAWCRAVRPASAPANRSRRVWLHRSKPPLTLRDHRMPLHAPSGVTPSSTPGQVTMGTLATGGGCRSAVQAGRGSVQQADSDGDARTGIAAPSQSHLAVGTGKRQEAAPAVPATAPFAGSWICLPPSLISASATGPLSTGNLRFWF